MEINQLIGIHAEQPLPHQLLISWLKGYKRPNDKILGLKAQGILEPLKKGLYIAGPSVTDKKPDVMLVANHLLGPSYVSMSLILDLLFSCLLEVKYLVSISFLSFLWKTRILIL